MSHSEHDTVDTSDTETSKSTQWAHFLAQRERRKLLIKQKKEASDKHSASPASTPRSLTHKSSQLASYCNISPKSSPSLSSSLSTHSSPHTPLGAFDLIELTTPFHCNTRNTNTTYLDLYGDIMIHLCTFLELHELPMLVLTCKSWHSMLNAQNKHNWRAWYNALNTAMKRVASLDRTGTSNHCIVTQNAYTSYDSVYHFSKFALYASFCVEFDTKRSNKANPMHKSGNAMYNALREVNKHSPSMVGVFVDRLLRNNIMFEPNDDLEPSLSSGAGFTGFGVANPELIYLNNYYSSGYEDTASDTDTSDVDAAMVALNVIVIDDQHYDDNDKHIVLIRSRMRHMMAVYGCLVRCIKEKSYVKLLRLFENVILIESRPLLRWFLYVLDRAQCFGCKECVSAEELLLFGKVYDITVFLKHLASYIRGLIREFGALRSVYSLQQQACLQRHQQYLLKMCVDIDETRARGVSSLDYWLRSGTMVCNPDM